MSFTTLRMFLAVPVPRVAVPMLEAVMPSYESLLTSRVSVEKWHITLLWLGEVETTVVHNWQETLTSISQTHLPVMRITHIGQGKKQQQLWAYIQPTRQLHTLRQTLSQHVGQETGTTQEFVPHITLGSLDSQAQRFGPPEHLVGFSFVFDYVTLYASDRTGTTSVYTSKASLALPAA